MKSLITLAFTLVLTAALLVGCGCTNQNTNNTSAPTVLPTNEEIWDNSEPTTRYTTESTTSPTRDTGMDATGDANGSGNTGGNGSGNGSGNAGMDNSLPTDSTTATESTMEGRARSMMPGRR